MIQITNEDNMELMKRYPNNYFDLAIVDPPYGINFAESIEKNTWNKKLKNKHVKKNWDKEIPNKAYFDELFRVSKNQIIWGGNYFLEYLPSTTCFLVWFKSQNFTGADFELAWTSFKSPSRSFKMSRIEAHGNENKIHPTQKNIKIYRWIYSNYAVKKCKHVNPTCKKCSEPTKVLDTHLGSGNSAVASSFFNIDFTGCDIDKEYFDKATVNISNHMSQTKLF